MNTFDEFDDECAKFDRGSPIPSAPLAYYALAMGESGEVQNQVKKLYRDDGGVITAERQEKIVNELGDLLWYMSRLAQLAGSSLTAVARYNGEKLAARRSGNPGKYGSGGLNYAERQPDQYDHAPEGGG